MMRNCVLLFLLIGYTAFAQLNPSLPPSSNFDLSAWKLQTLDTNYNFFELSTALLTAGYTSNFFFTNPTDGSMVFKVPSNGGTTSGTTYPRVEFRQVSKGANWPLADTTEHFLTAQCRVITVASAKPQIIIGQVHGFENNSELLKLRWTGEQPGQCYIEARFQKNDSVGAEYGVTLASGLSRGSAISYTIRMKSGKISVTVNGASASQTYTSLYYGTTDKYYFKAGNYLQYTSTDTSVFGQTQFYKLSLISTPVGVDDKPLATKSEAQYSLCQNYPNPFNPSTTIVYNLAKQQFVTLKVFDLLGNEIKSLVNEEKPAGQHTAIFMANGLPSGMYFYTLHAGSYSETKRLILLK